tara:strand:+ start:460 stop:1140 length:681 start_codon:yes stop_codon:yes gene_type:complete
MAFTSPPYNIHLRVNKDKTGYISRGSADTSSVISKKYNNYTDDLPINDYYTMCSNVIDLLLTQARLIFWNVQLLTGNKRAVFRLIGNYEEYIKDVIVWDKQNVAPAVNKKVMNSRYELIIIFSQKEKSITRSFDNPTFNKAGFDNVITQNTQGRSIKTHGATMPIEIAHTLLDAFAKTDDIILDPYAGTGTTLRAAKNLGIKSVGIEIDKNYCDIASQRLAQEVLL